MEQNGKTTSNSFEEIYQSAQLLVEGGLYSEAAATFDRIPDYKDAAQRKAECLAMAESADKDEIYAAADKAAGNPNVKSQEKAIRLFERIRGWRDADERIEEANRRIEEITVKERADREEAQRLAEIDRQKRLKRKKRIIRTSVIAAAVVVVCLVGAFLFRKYAVPALKYKKSVTLIESGETDEAYRILHGLNYRDSSDLVFDIAKDRFQNAEIGSTVLFGSYPSGKNVRGTKDSIEWVVLDKDGSKLLLISKYAIECMPYDVYNPDQSEPTWMSCYLRKWLNDSFIDYAFDAGETRFLLRTQINDDSDPTGHSNTVDKVFLLSASEAQTYFADDEARKCFPTQHAIDYGAYRSSIEHTCLWWLRSASDPTALPTEYDEAEQPPVDATSRVICIGTSGQIVEIGHAFYNREYTVRPAIWIDTDPPAILPF